jgi:lysyl-tRNA synthetase class 2
MMPSDWQPKAALEIIKLRARVLQDTRAFFHARGVLEVETPVLSSASASDIHIQSLQTSISGQPSYLHTSPEYPMKRLLAAHGAAIYQICKVFRDDEQGPVHNPEFSMLEWYRPDFDLSALMAEVESLIIALSPGSTPGFARISYREAFELSAGFNPHRVTVAECRDCADRHGIETPVGLENNIDEWLDWLLTQLVLPALPSQRYTFIYDYPASQCALARLGQNAQGDSIAQRFELLYGELELANGFFELQDATEQRARFEADNAVRSEMGLAPAILDERLLAALAHGLPETSGVALGLDRLLMVLSGADSIEDVLTFSWRNA